MPKIYFVNSAENNYSMVGSTYCVYPRRMCVTVHLNLYQDMLGISTARQVAFQTGLPVGGSFRSIPYVPHPRKQFTDLRFNKHRTILYLRHPRKTATNR